MRWGKALHLAGVSLRCWPAEQLCSGSVCCTEGARYSFLRYFCSLQIETNITLCSKLSVTASQKEDERHVNAGLWVPALSSALWMQLNNCIGQRPWIWHKINLWGTDRHEFGVKYSKWWYLSFVNRRSLQCLAFRFSIIAKERKGSLMCSWEVEGQAHAVIVCVCVSVLPFTLVKLTCSAQVHLSLNCLRLHKTSKNYKTT